MSTRHKCFVNIHCSSDCPNFAVSEFEYIYDIPASDAGLERIQCRDCHYNTGRCEDCLLSHTEVCHDQANLY